MTLSHMDGNKTLTQRKWNVTLIRVGRHAEIIVEGIDNQDSYVCKLIHMTGFGSSRKLYSNVGVACGVYPGCISKPGIEIKDLSSKSRILYDAKGPTWEISKDTAENLINNATKEKTNPHVKFSLFGRHAFFNVIKQMLGFPPADNCVTWALDQLLSAGISISILGNGFNVINDSISYTSPNIKTNALTIKELCQFAKTGNINAINTNFSSSFNVNEVTKNACAGPVESFLGWYTPLSLAVAYNQYETVKILIEKYHADPLVCAGRKHDYNALDCAKHKFWFTGGAKDKKIQAYLSEYIDAQSNPCTPISSR